MSTPLWVDGVYVLTVKTFTDRIAHIKAELARHQIDFEFVLDYDIPDLNEKLIEQYFVTKPDLTPAHYSLMLKHACAWKRAYEKGQRQILIFEDDVILRSDFKSRVQKILAAAQQLEPGYLLFLGGANEKVPPEYFLEKGPLFKNAIGTAEAYISDRTAIEKRLEWMKSHRFDRPADHQIKLIDQEAGVAQYWSTTPLVEQGSILGLFQSHLDRRRQKHSLLFNRIYYYGKVFRKKTFPKFWTRLRANLGLYRSKSR